MFPGIPEQQDEDPEPSIKRFLKKKLKLPTESIKKHIFPSGAPPGRDQDPSLRRFQAEGTGEKPRQGAERKGLETGNMH